MAAASGQGLPAPELLLDDRRQLWQNPIRGRKRDGWRCGEREPPQEALDREDGRSPMAHVALHRIPPKREPVGRGKVDCFCHIEAVREASVIGARESDDELSRALLQSVHGHALCLEVGGRDHRDELVEQVRRILED